MWTPLPSSWLHICRQDGQVAKGGFLSSIENVYCIATSNSLRSKQYYQMHHVPDVEIRIPPGFVTNQRFSHAYSQNLQLPEHQITYHKLLLKLSTYHALCKCTVSGLLYRNIIPTPNILHLKFSTCGQRTMKSTPACFFPSAHVRYTRREHYLHAPT
jgi:hypothetical protein